MRLGDRFSATWTASLAVAAAAITVHPEFETDPFWHMTLARSVLEHRSRTVPEPTALEAFSDPCVVPEWLWGVLALGLHKLGAWGPPAGVALLAAACVVALVAMLRAAKPDLPRGVLAALSGVLAAMALMRLRLRPEAAALVLLPAFIAVTYRYVRHVAADARRRRVLGAVLVAMEIVWAQLHGSFVLAPAVFAILAAPAALRREDRKVDLAVFGLLIVGLLSSAYGLDVGGYVLGHAHSDSTRHIVDWLPLQWEDFAPKDWLDGRYGGPYGAACALLASVSVLGMVSAHRVFYREAALAGLGLALMSTGCRFLAMGTILAGPLAAYGAAALAAVVPASPLLRFRWAGAAVGALFLAAQARGMHLARGPLGRIGLAEGNYPLAAAEFLRALPGDPIRVLTSYDAGAPLGFWLRGKVRTYVDSRTPLYFDDTDFGLARDVFRAPDAMARAIRRYDVAVVVMPRTSGACKGLSADWVPVVIEPRFTTFVPRPTAAALSALAPCGKEYLGEDACRDGGARLDDDIDRLARLRGSRFVDYLRAERVLRCGGAVDRVAELLPSAADAAAFRPQRDRAQAVLFLKTGRPREAIEVLADAVREGDTEALALIGHTLGSEETPAATTRELLSAAVEHLDDATPPDLRALLALTCAEQGDHECARFHAIRAAAGGSATAQPTLKWLSEHHPSARVREDAAAWLAVLREQVKAAPVGRP